MKHGEDSLQIVVANFIRAQYPRLLWWHTPNGMMTSGSLVERGKRINRFKQMGMLVGVSDIVMFWDDKKAAIELKFGNNGMTENQIEFRNRWVATGGLFALCRSLDDVQFAMNSWDIPKGVTVCPPLPF